MGESPDLRKGSSEGRADSEGLSGLPRPVQGAVQEADGEAPLEDSLGACSHLAEVTSPWMDLPETVRALQCSTRVEVLKEFLSTTECLATP